MNRKAQKTPPLCLAALMAAALTASAELSLADWDKGLSVGLNLADGNSDTVNLNAGLHAEKGTVEDEQRCAAGVDYNYGETGTQETVDNLQAFIRHSRDISGNTYGYGGVSYLRDDIALVDYRVTVGVGLGQYLIRDATTGLVVEFGVDEIFDDVGGITDEAFALRFAENLEHELSDTARIWQSVEFLPEASDFDNYLLNLEIGAEADMNDRLSLNVVVQDRYDSTPAVGRKSNDVTVLAGLGYKL